MGIFEGSCLISQKYDFYFTQNLFLFDPWPESFTLGLKGICLNVRQLGLVTILRMKIFQTQSKTCCVMLFLFSVFSCFCEGPLARDLYAV